MIRAVCRALALSQIRRSRARDEAEALTGRYAPAEALVAARALPVKRRAEVERHLRRILDRLATAKGADRWPGP